MESSIGHARCGCMEDGEVRLRYEAGDRARVRLQGGEAEVTSSHPEFGTVIGFSALMPELE